MGPDTIEAIKAALVPVAEKIGQGAAFGWEVVVRQQYVTAMGDFLFAVIGIALGLYALNHAKRFIAEAKAYRENRGAYSSAGDGIYLGAFGLALGGGVMFLMSVHMLYDGLAHIINPNYYAIQFFIGLATGTPQ